MNNFRYVLKHKATGWVLPIGPGKSGRGFTHVEPVDPEENLPRLFKSPQAAMAALGWWLKGKTTVGWMSTSYETPDILDEEDWRTEPVPGRNKEEWQVYIVDLQYIGPYIKGQKGSDPALG
jgi:hypothetical protein